MTRKKKAESDEPTFPSRAAAEGTAIGVFVAGEERTLEATKGPDGWAITPTDAAEAAALEQFTDEALNPPPPPEPDEAADAEDGAEDSAGNDEDAGDGEGGQA